VVATCIIEEQDSTMVEDIRNVRPEEHWVQFEKAWTTLLTYRYLGKLNPGLDAGVERETMPLRHDMRNSTGGIMAAPLCIACPEPWWNDDQCVPAPVVMSYEILDPARDVRQVVVSRDVIHLGRNMGFSRSRIADADEPERLIAVSSGTGVSLGAVPEGYEKVENPSVPVDDSPSLPPLHVVFGATRGTDGLWRLPPLQAEMSAPHAALHLGPINIVLERAAMDRLAAHTGTDALQAESWTVMMVRPGTIGPFRAVGEIITGGSERLPVQLTLYDEGNRDRVIATAVGIYRRV
jgi:acyl-coenzyme A thioesterase PaaI-like protein